VSEAEGLGDSLAMVWGAPDAAAALDEWARHLARFHPRVLAITQAMDRVRRTDRDAAAHWDLVSADWLACCARLARRLDAEGRLHPAWTVATATDMLYGLMSFGMLEALLVDRRWPAKRYADRLATVMRSTFLRDGG
jgi:hypothetical protein